MISLLKNAVTIKIIRSIDFYFSQFITKTNSIVMLVAACVSYESNNGHFFVPIEYFEKNFFFSNVNNKFIQKILKILGKEINWLLELKKHPSINNGSIPTPLVLFEKKIYLYKSWKSKKNILQYLYKNNTFNKINQNKCCYILKKLFPEQEKNLQKIAVALTLINKITFIIGGPGTGKTTTVLKIIIALIKNSKKNIKIQLSAPTGKAATRLNTILKDNYLNIHLSEREKKYLSFKAVTIHQLLGISKISEKSFFNKNNKLDLDVLIIDETSMIDILMMEKIFFALSKSTKIIFIGDYNQLRPIESGSILKDICRYSNNQYSFELACLLEKITQYSFLNKQKEKITFISDNVCLLKKNYRFNKNSGIYILSNGIYNNKKEIVEDACNNKIKDIFFDETNCIIQYQKMITNIIANYENYWKKIHERKSIKEIIKTFQKYQVLCMLRDSSFGVNFINAILEESMHKKNIIKYFYKNKKIWYIGKPIMITRNNTFLELSNGDLGITNINNKNQLQVSFLEKNNNIKNVPINILKNYESAWAITVHKSQGSEFTNVALILPNFNSKVLSKDILYTGITRCRKSLYIFSNKEIFISTALKKIKNEVISID